MTFDHPLTQLLLGTCVDILQHAFMELAAAKTGLPASWLQLFVLFYFVTWNRFIISTPYLEVDKKFINYNKNKLIYNPKQSWGTCDYLNSWSRSCGSFIWRIQQLLRPGQVQRPAFPPPLPQECRTK